MKCDEKRRTISQLHIGRTSALLATESRDINDTRIHFSSAEARSLR